jgi:AcrR family transcriptional regulator
VPHVSPTTPASAAVRSDVQRNRRALLDAARQLLAVRGDVPMYEVARRAGVGQATLYRHFPDRRALIAAVAEEVLDAVEEEAAAIPPGPGALEALLRLIVASMVRTHALLQVVEDESSNPREPGTLLHGLVQRLLGMVAERFAPAKAAGVLRQDLTVDDVMLVLGMAKGVIEGLPADERDAASARALELALHGILAPRRRGG